MNEASSGPAQNPSHPHTACTVLNIYADNAHRLYPMVNEPAELQGYLVDASRSPVNIYLNLQGKTGGGGGVMLTWAVR